MVSKLKEFNAQVRKDYKNELETEQQASEHLSEGDEIDEQSDDEFIKALENKKQERVNVERLTKRQRMNHMAKHNLGSRGQFSAMEGSAEMNDFDDFSEGLPI